MYTLIIDGIMLLVFMSLLNSTRISGVDVYHKIFRDEADSIERSIQQMKAKIAE